jgi:hypothetical protein
MLHLQRSPRVSFRAPEKDPPFRVPITETLHRERCSISRALFTYIQIPRKMPTSRFPFQTPTEKDAPFPEPFSSCLSQVPHERTHRTQGFQSGYRCREMLITMAYSTYPQKFPITEPPSKYPSKPYGKRCPSPGPSTRIIYKAQQKIPPSTFHSQSPNRE